MLSVNIAEAAKAAKPTPGTISKIDGNPLTITPRAQEGSTETPADITVTADDKTTVTINGETKAVSDLKVGDKVRVTLGEDGKTATAIQSGKAPLPPPPPPPRPATKTHLHKNKRGPEPEFRASPFFADGLHSRFRTQAASYKTPDPGPRDPEHSAPLLTSAPSPPAASPPAGSYTAFQSGHQ